MPGRDLGQVHNTFVRLLNSDIEIVVPWIPCPPLRVLVWCEVWDVQNRTWELLLHSSRHEPTRSDREVYSS